MGQSSAEKLLDLIGKLGNSADSIARNLYLNRIKSFPADKRHCAVAEYLTSMGYTDVEVTDRIFATNGERVHVILNGRRFIPIRKFIAKFDEGTYPQLVDEETVNRWSASGRRFSKVKKFRAKKGEFVR